MSAILAFPFQLTPKGSVATIDDGSSAGQGQQLGVLVSTRLGERVMVQAFGISDPVFVGVNAPELQAAVAKWGPMVTLDSIAITYSPDGSQQNVTVDFH
jgi:phage baseplate assembly protein W